MSKTINLIFLLLLSHALLGQAQNQTIPPCPNSPNCVSTTHKKSSQQFQPLRYNSDLDEAKATLKTVMKDIHKANLSKEKGNVIYYEFNTKVGKFTDDVVFHFDDNKKEIHFRSASRKGYHDMGANKRRMKKIIKAWKANKSPKGFKK